MPAVSPPARDRARSFVPRFAGEAFSRAHNPREGPALRRLVSQVAWKRPPASTVRAEVSV